MRHEKIIKRPDGRRIQISVTVYLDSLKGSCYDLFIMVCEPRKRKFECIVNTDDYKFRGLSMEDRKAYTLNEYLKYATLVEIQTAKEELWQLLKPTE